MRSACFALSTLILATSSFAHGRGDEHQPPLRIRFMTPDAGHFQGLTTTTGWALTLRIEAPDAIAIVETAEPNDTPQSRREAIVLTDPDGCLDMRHFPISNAGQAYHDCDGPDETFVEFTTERFDTFDLADSNTGNFEIRRDWLVDGAPNAAPPLFLVNRPQTGGALLDGYGFGPDDDLPGLVILSDVGAARVFDQNFDRVAPAAVRNLAGFLNSVAQELSTKRGGSALTAWMHVPAGLFEPIALFDLDVGTTGPGGSYLRRLENGPIRSFTFTSTPANDDALLAEIASTYAPYTIDVRALVVEGYAPTVILDKNRDGRFTAIDLKLMGHKVISNEARLRQQIDLDVLVTETLSGRTCPPQTLVFRDLDGNGRSGAIPCQGSGGAARVRGVPQ